MSTPEGKVKDKFKRWWKRHFPSAWVFMPVQHGYGVHGVPDYVCCFPMKITKKHVGKTIGVFAGIEAKAEKGILSKHQQHQLDLIKKAHGLAFVIRGLDEEFHAPLTALRLAIKGADGMDQLKES